MTKFFCGIGTKEALGDICDALAAISNLLIDVALPIFDEYKLSGRLEGLMKDNECTEEEAALIFLNDNYATLHAAIHAAKHLSEQSYEKAYSVLIDAQARR